MSLECICGDSQWELLFREEALIQYITETKHPPRMAAKLIYCTLEIIMILFHILHADVLTLPDFLIRIFSVNSIKTIFPDENLLNFPEELLLMMSQWPSSCL